VTQSRETEIGYETKDIQTDLILPNDAQKSLIGFQREEWWSRERELWNESGIVGNPGGKRVRTGREREMKWRYMCEKLGRGERKRKLEQRNRVEVEIEVEVEKEKEKENGKEKEETRRAWKSNRLTRLAIRHPI
jgi:hypothetical protein